MSSIQQYVSDVWKVLKRLLRIYMEFWSTRNADLHAMARVCTDYDWLTVGVATARNRDKGRTGRAVSPNLVL